MNHLYAFSKWDPLQGEVPEAANEVFRSTVQAVRSLVKGRTLPELVEAVRFIQALKLDWMESTEGAAPGAGDPSSGGNASPGFPAAEELEILKDRTADLSAPQAGIPNARPFEYFAAWALYKAAAVVIAMERVTRLKDRANPLKPDKASGANADERRQYANARENMRCFSEEFYEAASHAEQLQQQSVSQPDEAVAMNRREMADLGRRGGQVRNRPTREVRLWVLREFRAVWKKRRWASVRQAARSLQKSAIEKARELHAPCLYGDEENAFRTIYTRWILPYYNRYLKEKVVDLAASATTAGGQLH
ncbi:MAG: hypothetical protein KA419_14270 [Acidobacteria bacterium]|nr:hypothetical protein [Acidobacteriota bacterium]